jgi:hypothetical protein
MNRTSRRFALVTLLAASASSVAIADTSVVPDFTFVPAPWLPPLVVDPSPGWAAAGFPERGFGAATLAGPPSATNPIFQHFDPSNVRYQAFVGAYVIDHFVHADLLAKPAPTQAELVTATTRVGHLIEVDNDAFLAQFGTPLPATKLVPGSVHVDPEPDDEGFYHAVAAFEARSSVGAPVSPLPFYPALSAFAGAIGAYDKIFLFGTTRFKLDPATGKVFFGYTVSVIWETRAAFGLPCVNDASKKCLPRVTPASVVAEQSDMLDAIDFVTLP